MKNLFSKVFGRSVKESKSAASEQTAESETNSTSNPFKNGDKTDTKGECCCCGHSDRANQKPGVH